MTQDNREKQTKLRYDCIITASTLNKFDADGNRINLSPEEIVEAATKFFNFAMSAEQQKDT